MNKAVALAKDVITRLSNLRGLTQGAYLLTSPLSDNQVVTLIKHDNAQEILPFMEKECSMCALGACFLSYIRLYDNFKVSECIQNGDDHLQVMSGQIYQKMAQEEIFSFSEMSAIESAYEGFGNSYYTNNYPDKHDRLEAIMQNVIDNGGRPNLKYAVEEED